MGKTHTLYSRLNADFGAMMKGKPYKGVDCG